MISGAERAVIADPGPPVSIQLPGATSTVPAECLTSYAPTVGDLVAVVREGNRLLIVGSLGTPTRTGGTFTGTVDGTSTVAIPHGLGAVPARAFAIGVDAVYQLRHRSSADDLTSVRFTVRDSSGNTLTTGTSVTVDWEAHR